MADKKLNFIKRIENPKDSPFLTNEDGSVSTHRMAAEVDEDGNWYAFPTIVELPDGTLHQFKENRVAMDYAIRTGEFLKMPGQREAIDYAEGGYKVGTPLETFNPLENN